MIHPKIKSLSLFTRSKLCGTQNVKLSWDCQLQNQNKGILKVLHTRTYFCELYSSAVFQDLQSHDIIDLCEKNTAFEVGIHSKSFQSRQDILQAFTI